MFYVLFFIFGASIGSFVQVVVTRLNVAPIINGRSKCLSCGEALRAFDLVPLFSYLFLKGKCRYCNTAFGSSSLYIELFYGSIYVLLYNFILLGQQSLLVSSLWLVYYTFLFIVMGVIALYDLKHTYIPVFYLMGYLALSLIMLCLRYLQDGTSVTLIAPLVVSMPFMILWVVSRGKWLGFGDVILFLGAGAFFGIEQGLAVLLISIWMGAIVGVVRYLYLGEGIRNKSLPFVPFIMIAFLLVLFTDLDIFSLLSLFA